MLTAAKNARFLFAPIIFIVVFSFSSTTFAGNEPTAAPFLNILNDIGFQTPNVGYFYADKNTRLFNEEYFVYAGVYPDTSNQLAHFANFFSFLSMNVSIYSQNHYWEFVHNADHYIYQVYYHGNNVWSQSAPTCSDGIQNQDETGVDTGGTCTVLSSEKAIASFNLEGLDPDVNGVIDEGGHIITLNVPFGTDLSTLVPTITVSAAAFVSPLTGLAQDFTNPVTYTVIAEDASTQAYTVTVSFVCTENCYSNVMFLPGLMGSRLYWGGILCVDDLNDPLCQEKELWTSAEDALQKNLVLDTNGKSVNGVYTKDDTENTGEPDETGIVDDVDSFNIYQSFITDLKNWKDTEHLIQDYAFIPYDWRLSLDDVITNGHVSGNKLSYTTAQDFSESFILQKLEALQANSKSGKVTIIAHSNGGLVAKALIQKIHDTNNPLYDKIDKVIFVAVPQVGTPDAMASLLYGTELGYGLIMNNKVSRQLSENMPSIYNFLPSAAYFTTVDPGSTDDTLISFESKPFFSAQTSLYGFFVSTITEMKNYILGGDSRTKPTVSDTAHPNIGNQTLYEQAEAVHQTLDSWAPSQDTKVIQVAGWGEETLAGLDYVALNDRTEHLSHKPQWVVDGDGTVVTPSALWMSDAPNTERWWVDLDIYNEPFFGINRKHRDIFEVPNLLNFIKYKITDESSFDNPQNILLDDDSTLISTDPRLHFTLHSPLTLGIFDSQGRYTGMDPITRTIKEEIPDVIYRQIGEVQYLSVPFNVAYTVKLQGYAEGYFSLNVDKQVGNDITDTILFEGIKSSTYTIANIDVIPDYQVSTTQIKVDEDGDGSFDKTYKIADGQMQATNLKPIPSGNSSTPSTSGASYLAVPVVETPTVKTIQDIAQIIQKSEEKQEITQEIQEETTKTEEAKKGEDKSKTKIIEEAQASEIQAEDISLSAAAANSGVGIDWVPYVTIGSIIALSFIARMFLI